MAATSSGRAKGSSLLSWDVECGIGEAGCAKLISALERANAAFSAALVFRRPVIIKISAISGGASGKRAEPTEADAFAATDAPQHQLPARIGSALVSYPQTLAKQMSVLPDEDLLPFDAIISVRWPEGGFFFEGDMASTSSVQNPNFDAMLHHEMLHVFGLTSAFTVLPGLDSMLTTNLNRGNGTMTAGFSLINSFDSFLVDTESGERLSNIWANAAPFRAEEASFAAEFQNNSAAKSAQRLYNLATTPDRISFKLSDNERISIDTSLVPFLPGRSLCHFSPSANITSDLFHSTVPNGPLNDTLFADPKKRILALNPTVASTLRALGWSLCADSKDDCLQLAVATTVTKPSSSIAPWLIAVIAIAGAAFLLVAGFLAYRWTGRRKPTPVKDEQNEEIPDLGPSVEATDKIFLRPAPSLPDGFKVVRLDMTRVESGATLPSSPTESIRPLITPNERLSMSDASLNEQGYFALPVESQTWRRMRTASVPLTPSGMPLTPSGMPLTPGGSPPRQPRAVAGDHMRVRSGRTDGVRGSHIPTTIALPPSSPYEISAVTSPLMTPGGTRKKKRRPNMALDGLPTGSVQGPAALGAPALGSPALLQSHSMLELRASGHNTGHVRTPGQGRTPGPLRTPGFQIVTPAHQYIPPQVVATPGYSVVTGGQYVLPPSGQHVVPSAQTARSPYLTPAVHPSLGTSPPATAPAASEEPVDYFSIPMHHN